MQEVRVSAESVAIIDDVFLDDLLLLEVVFPLVRVVV